MKNAPVLLAAMALLWSGFAYSQPGSPDPSFGGGDGFSTLSFLSNGHSSVNAMAVQANGRILVAGDTWLPNGTENGEMAIARFMPNGSADPTFSGDGKTTLSLANMAVGISDMLILPDGKILCAGNAWNQSEDYYFLLARFNANGTPDNSFDGDGIVITRSGVFRQSADALAVQQDGKIIVAGYINSSGYNDVAVLRFKPDGTLDNSFGGGDGIVTTQVGESYASARDVLIQPDGKIIAAGYAVVNGFEDFAILRYNSNGTVDHSFDGDGIVMISFTNKEDEVFDAALQPDGKIVLAGSAGVNGGQGDPEMAVARLTATGLPDPAFGGGDGKTIIHITDYYDIARAIALQPDGKILLGGSSLASNSSSANAHFALVRITKEGIPDPSFGGGDGISGLPVSSDGDFIKAIALQADGKVLAAGDARLNDYNAFVVARFLTGVTVDSTVPAVFSDKISLYPNPVIDQVTLEYSLESDETISANLYDLQGRFIQNMLPPSLKTAGKQLENMAFIQDIPAGTYLLELSTGEESAVIKIIIQ